VQTASGVQYRDTNDLDNSQENFPRSEFPGTLPSLNFEV
jgi:hypothetical protein